MTNEPDLQEPEQQPINELIEDIALKLGVDIEACGDGSFPCGGTAGRTCQERAPTRDGYCAACAQANVLAMRRWHLSEARKTLPPLNLGQLPETVRPECVKLARDWRRETGSVTVLGPSRCGKTSAALAICNRILDTAMHRALPVDDMEFARGVRFYEAKEIARARANHRLGHGESEIETSAKAASLLVIDEFGLEKRDANGDNAIDEVIQFRSLWNKLTIVTSGRPREKLIERYGAGIWARLSERAVVIDMFGGRNV